jgi:hypothetical protein
MTSILDSSDEAEKEVYIMQDMNLNKEKRGSLSGPVKVIYRCCLNSVK